jgi:hypothetical protein
MIGVIAHPAEHDVVRELFELFKTPWEFHRRTRRYDVVLCADADDAREANADLVLVYAGGARPPAAGATPPVDPLRARTVLSYRGWRLPVYGRSLTFPSSDMPLREEATGRAGARVTRSGERVRVWIGYDLFGEIRTALTTGQPMAHAGVPAVDVHIALLRDLILDAGIPLVEIPPLPDGYPFIACLTHDVDHPSIRRHGWDHTTFGFLYRAVVGSLLDVARGRASVRSLLTNWAAALTVPLVHAGVVKDFWADFDRYLKIDAGLGSTFFVIPFAGEPGHTPAGPAPARRAARYGARDIACRLRTLASAGAEIGVHGIDAWHDSARGRQELDEVAGLTAATETGVRMHWLYSDAGSPAALEKAGFVYDATSGYNGTVGYRAGTTQVFKPLDAIRLLELPLHVMDTALFYPRHLHLAPPQARGRVDALIDNARQLGGTLTINWHDRSIAPERLWGDFYEDLVAELKRHQPWFATAGRAVAWFRRRRATVFEAVSREPGLIRVKVSAGAADDLPGLRLRIHTGRDRHRDVPLNGGLETAIPI